MKLSDQLRRASAQSAPGVNGRNPFAALLLQAARHIDDSQDTLLLDFLEGECAVTVRFGSSTVVNPTDLRRALTNIQEDHSLIENAFPNTAPTPALRLAS